MRTQAVTIAAALATLLLIGDFAEGKESVEAVVSYVVAPPGPLPAGLEAVAVILARDPV